MKLKYIFGALFTVAVATSCEDRLNLEPEQSLSVETALGTVDDLETAILGAYDRMQQLNYYGRDFVVVPEVASDNILITTDNAGRYVNFYAFNVTPDNVGPTENNVYTDAYEVINAANNIINNFENVSREGNEARLDQILGEALFLRALAHFDLVRFFGRPYIDNNGANLGVPIVRNQEEANPARNTVAEVYNELVIPDLIQAAGLMSFISPFRASNEAANALLSRVYLYKGEYAKAVEAANKVSGFTLVPTENFVASWNTSGSSEEILTLRFAPDENRGSDNLGNIYLETGYGDLRPTLDLINEYPEGDVRLGFIDDVVEDGARNDDYLVKYPGTDGIPGLASPRIIRYAEVLLNRAEANARLNNFDEARADLNAIRQRAGIGDSEASDSELVEAILEERRRELAGEGHRLFDIFRVGDGLIRVENTGLGGAPSEVSFSDLKIIFPIPQREIDANTNLVQNSAWSE